MFFPKLLFCLLKGSLHKVFQIIGFILVLHLISVANASDSESNQLLFKLNDLTVTNSIYFTIPFPQKVLHYKDKLKLTYDGTDIPFKAYSLLNWPESNGLGNLRLVAIYLPIGLNGDYQLSWAKSFKEPLQKVFIKKGDLQEVTLPEEWLNLLNYGPTGCITNSDCANQWYDKSFSGYGKWLSDKELTSTPKIKTSSWLYDKVFSYYQLYFRTGDNYWKQIAHQYANHYRDKINEEGWFTGCRANDLKCLNAGGLILDHLFYPDEINYEIIAQFYKNSLSWPARYDNSKGFWTERHLSSALSIALSWWELTGEDTVYQRIESLLSSIQEQMQGNTLGCLAHTNRQHENKNDDTLVCSPWMTALVYEPLWRFYFLTQHQQTGTILMGLSNFMTEKGIFYSENNHLRDQAIPDYLVFFEPSVFIDRNAWTDREHACDVTGMMLRSAYVRKLNNVSNHEQINIAKKLLKTCEKTMFKNNSKAWTIKPDRKFNWWFSTTYNMPFLIQKLGIE